MHSQDTPPLEWRQAGSTYFALHEGKIAALLYFDDLHVLDDDGAFVAGSHGWFLIMADDPHRPTSLAAPVVTHGMEDDELVAARRAAVEVATMMVQERLREVGGQ